MHSQSLFQLEDPHAMHHLMRAYPLATLVAVTREGLEANLLPLELCTEAGGATRLRGHVGREHPLVQPGRDGIEVLVVCEPTPCLVANLQSRIAEEKGEVTADVTSATKLSAAQAKKLAETLKASVGKTVKLNTTVDESLIGGLIVKLGSTMIDTSVKSKLAALQNAMKEVG